MEKLVSFAINKTYFFVAPYWAGDVITITHETLGGPHLNSITTYNYTETQIQWFH